MATASLKQAMRLKEVSTQVMSMYTPNVPPETFLYRGNSYMALAQPYYALSDYICAAAAMPLSGKHEVRAREAIQSLPPLLHGIFTSTDEHLGFLVEQALAPETEIRRNDDPLTAPLLPRSLYVKKDSALKEGGIVIRRHGLFASYPLKSNRCLHCAKEFGVRHFMCQNQKCHGEFCSRDCRAASMSSYHGRMCDNSSYQGIELAMYDRYQEAAADDNETKRFAACMLLTLKVLAMAIVGQCVPSALREIRTLPGSVYFCPQTFEGEVLLPYLRFVKATQTLNSICAEEFLGLFARISSNAVVTEDKINLSIPLSVVRRASSASQEPNAILVPDGSLRAIRDIVGGEEVIAKPW